MKKTPKPYELDEIDEEEDDDEPPARSSRSRVPVKAKAFNEQPRSKEDKRAEALDLLGVTEEEIKALPRIEPLLEQARILTKVWDYVLLGSEFDCSKKLLARYDWLKTAHLEKFVPFEAYCVSAKTPTIDVLAMLSKVLKYHADVLLQAKKLTELHDQDALKTAVGNRSVLPAIEDDIRTMSDKFNALSVATGVLEPEEDEEDDDDG